MKVFSQSKWLVYAWESLYTDGKWSTHRLYDFGFSRRFVLVRVLSKETPIVSVDLRTAEVSYTNQNKTAWKSEVVQTMGWPLPICVQTFPCVNESFWLAKYFHHSNYDKISYLTPIYMSLKIYKNKTPCNHFLKFLCFNLNLLLKCHNTHLTCIFVMYVGQ
jgi:hypothetical protein